MQKSLSWIVVSLLSISMIVTFSLVGCKGEAEEEAAEVEEAEEEAAETGEKEPVTLTLRGWAGETVELFNVYEEGFEALYPYIDVELKYTASMEYDIGIKSDLELGKGDDLYQIRSYDVSEALYDAGYLADINEELVPNLSNFDASIVDAFTAEDGTIYGIPYMASNHGVFYNKDVFDQYNLSEPETWEELIDICDILQANGVTPFMSGGSEGWVFWQVWYPGLAPSFYGGEEGRQKLMAGDMKFTDEPCVEAFEALKEIGGYHRDDFMAMTYMEGINLFLAGEGAMLIDGGWIEPLFGEQEFEIGWFGPPVLNRGDTPWLCFHVDNGIGINKDTEHPEEAYLLANWMASEDFGRAFMNRYVGEFVFIKGDYEGVGSPLMEEQLEFKKNANITIRVMQESLSRQDPTGGFLMEEAFIKMFTEDASPYEAAEIVQDGLATWYEPFME